MGLLDKTETCLHSKLGCKKNWTLRANLLGCDRWRRCCLWSLNVSVFYCIIVLWLPEVCQLPCESALLDKWSNSFKLLQDSTKKQLWCWRIICSEGILTKMSAKVMPPFPMPSPTQEGHILWALSRASLARNRHCLSSSLSSLSQCRP